jgi:uncharacterized repeat protein (TIGR01451 family)
MMKSMMTRVARLLAGVACAALVAGAASAQNNYTEAGSTVSNTFTLDYSVAGTPQPQINNTATPTTFTVDRLVDLDVAYQANVDDGNVAPGAVGEDLLFKITNNGNDNQAYSLAVFNETETANGFDTTSLVITYYVDDGDGVFEPGGDDGAGVTYTSGATPDIAPDAVLFVVVTGTVPTSQPDGDTADITLVADSLNPVTSLDPAYAATAGQPTAADDGINNNQTGAENVLADGAGTTRDVANAGDHSDTGTFTVASPDLVGSKTVSVIATDGSAINCATDSQVSANEYAVPGACIQYTITVQNQGSATATLTSLVDTLPADLTFVDAVFTNFTGGTPAEPAANTDCTGGACVVSQTGGTIAAGVTATVVIRTLLK